MKTAILIFVALIVLSSPVAMNGIGNGLGAAMGGIGSAMGRMGGLLVLFVLYMAVKGGGKKDEPKKEEKK